MAISARIILRPKRDAFVPVAVPAAVSVVHAGRVHEAREHPLGFFLIVGGQLELVVLDTLVLAEGALEGVEGAKKQDSACEQAGDFPNIHRMALFVLYGFAISPAS